VARVRPEVVGADHDMHHARPIDPRQLAAIFDAPQLWAGLLTCTGTKQASVDFWLAATNNTAGIP